MNLSGPKFPGATKSGKGLSELFCILLIKLFRTSKSLGWTGGGCTEEFVSQSVSQPVSELVSKPTVVVAGAEGGW